MEIKDANGIVIKDGDIITSFQNDGRPVLVYIDEIDGELTTQNYHSTLSLKNSVCKDDIIIGNIIDNPDLLDL